MATDPQTLLAQANCYACSGASNYDLELMKLALLRQLTLLHNPMADLSPQTLLAQANCYSCYAANPYMLKLIELGLLNSLIVSGGGGAQLVAYTGTDPTSDGLTPPDTNSPAIAYKQNGTGPTYGWNTVTKAWN